MDKIQIVSACVLSSEVKPLKDHVLIRYTYIYVYMSKVLKHLLLTLLRTQIALLFIYYRLMSTCILWMESVCSTPHTLRQLRSSSRDPAWPLWLPLSERTAFLLHLLCYCDSYHIFLHCILTCCFLCILPGSISIICVCVLFWSGSGYRTNGSVIILTKNFNGCGKHWSIQQQRNCFISEYKIHVHIFIISLWPDYFESIRYCRSCMLPLQAGKT